MTKSKKHLLLFSFLFLCLSSFAQNVFVASYNIRYKNQWDEEKGYLWKDRCRAICGQINFEEPTIIGMQEVLYAQLIDFKKALKAYNYIGVGRDDDKQAGEYAAIFYNKNKVNLLKEGHFWLSETPNKPSLGWDAACIRICTWGKFKDKQSQRVFYCFNLHTDHVGIEARKKSAKLLLQRIKQLTKPNDPIIITGDFNVDQTDETYKIIINEGGLNDSYVVAQHLFAENGTFNEFHTESFTTSRIDHIFVSKGFNVKNYAILTNCYWTPNNNIKERKGNDAPQQITLKHYTQRTPSDHYPVFVKLQWQGIKHTK